MGYIPKRFLGAFKAGHRISAKEFIDEDLARKLLKRVLESDYSDLEALKALDYLTKFNNEYHKAVIKKGDRSALHKTKKMRQERYHANNAKNRDVMSVFRHKVESLTPQPTETDEGTKLRHVYVEIHHREQEEVMVNLIDLKKELFD